MYIDKDSRGMYSLHDMTWGELCALWTIIDDSDNREERHKFFPILQQLFIAAEKGYL